MCSLDSSYLSFLSKYNILRLKNKYIRYSNYVNISKNINLSEKFVDTISLFQQFYIPVNKNRYLEIKKCLKYNCDNKYINKIYLLNERYYSNDELGINSKK